MKNANEIIDLVKNVTIKIIAEGKDGAVAIIGLGACAVLSFGVHELTKIMLRSRNMGI